MAEIEKVAPSLRTILTTYTTPAVGVTPVRGVIVSVHNVPGFRLPVHPEPWVWRTPPTNHCAVVIVRVLVPVFRTFKTRLVKLFQLYVSTLTLSIVSGGLMLTKFPSILLEYT